MSHLDGEVLTVQCLHLVQRLALQLLGLDPHCHGAPVEDGRRGSQGKDEGEGKGTVSMSSNEEPQGDLVNKDKRKVDEKGMGKAMTGVEHEKRVVIIFY